MIIVRNKGNTFMRPASWEEEYMVAVADDIFANIDGALLELELRHVRAALLANPEKLDKLRDRLLGGLRLVNSIKVESGMIHETE